MSSSNSAKQRITPVVMEKRQAIKLIDEHLGDDFPLPDPQIAVEVAARLREVESFGGRALIVVDLKHDPRMKSKLIRLSGVFPGEDDATAFRVEINEQEFGDKNSEKIVQLIKGSFECSGYARHSPDFRTILARALAKAFAPDNDRVQREQLYSKLISDEQALQITHEDESWMTPRFRRFSMDSIYRVSAHDYIRIYNEKLSAIGMHSRPFQPPTSKAVHEICDEVLKILLRDCQGFQRGTILRVDEITEELHAFSHKLVQPIQQSLLTDNGETCPAYALDLANEYARKVTKEIPGLIDVVFQDAIAGYHNDPSVHSAYEFAVVSPGIKAIAIHRIANLLYRQEVWLLSRLMSEEAHSRYGIDIHPGATIGSAFVIDHGTSTVIGETAVIGNHCTLYQGVTLGAYDFERDEDGNLLNRGGTFRRHPTLEDFVTVYSNATILGGETKVGRNSVIGANVRLTFSVPQESLVTIQLSPPKVRPRKSRIDQLKINTTTNQKIQVQDFGSPSEAAD